MTREERCRRLRQKIQAHRISRLGWSDRVFRFILTGLKYHDHLRDMDLDELESLWKVISGYRRSGRPVEWEYDSDGRYIYKLQMMSGWNDAMLRTFLANTYHKTHLNLLTEAERTEVRELLEKITQPPIEEYKR